MRWKAARRACFCLSAFAALFAGAADFSAQQAARRAFDAIAAHATSLKADQIAADPWARQIRILGLAWNEPGVSVRIGALRLAAAPAAFFPAAEALAEGNMARADDVTIETALATVKIRRIELSGSSVGPAELARILDFKSGASIGERVAELSASAVAIPELITISKRAPLEQKFIYRDILLTDIVKGKAAAARAEGASFSMSDPDFGDAEGAYGHMSAKSVDLVLAARIASGLRADPAEPEAALYESFAIDGFHLSNATARYDLGVAALSGRGVKARPLRMAWDEAKDADQAPLERKTRGALAYADILDSVSIDEMDASDLKFAMRGDEGALSLSIGHAAIAQLDGAKLDGLTVQNLAFANQAAKIGLEGLALRRINLGRLQDALAGSPAHGQGAALAAPGGTNPPVAEDIVWTRLDADIADPKPGRDSARAAFEVARLEIRTSNETEGAPTRIEAALDHFTHRLDQGGEGALRDLAAMGYSQLDLSSRAAIAWDEAGRELSLDTIALEGADMGKLQISGLFSNVARTLFSSNPMTASIAVLDALLKKLDLRVENTGLFEKLIARQAARQHKSVDEMRQTYARAATVYLPLLLENGPAAQAIAAAVAKFVANPKSFHLVMTARDGLGLADLTSIQAPGALLKKLAIEASANE